MAASEKTAVLGLSLWAGTDKPRRSDFVSAVLSLTKSDRRGVSDPAQSESPSTAVF